MSRVRAAVATIAGCLWVTGCASAPPEAEKADGRHYPVTVSFGPDSNTLLLGTCPKDGEDSRDCRVELLDVVKNRSVAFTAPVGRYLHMPSLAADGQSILAVATAIQADETGNRAATIVRFDPRKPERGEQVVSGRTEIQFPLETDAGLTYWTKVCDGPKDRYCAHDPLVQWRGDAEPHGLGRSYGFRTVGPIFLIGRSVFATAAYPADLPFGSLDVTSPEDTNGFWRLGTRNPKGFEKVPQLGLAGLLGTIDSQGKTYLLGQDDHGIGFFEAAQDSFVRFSKYPDEAGNGSIQSLAVAAKGARIAAVVSFPRQVNDKTILLLSDGPLTWKIKPVPEPRQTTALALTGAERTKNAKP